MTKDMEDGLIATIRVMYDVDPIAKVFFEKAAARTNDVAETSIERIASMVR